MRVSSKTCVMVLTALMLVISSLAVAGCDGNNDNGTNGKKTGAPDSITITIGNLTDVTGPAANAMSVIDMAVEDVARYYNENNLIPGVELKVIEYDTQYDPSRFIPGYQWLKEKGADLIWNALPPGVTTLQSEADKDQFPIYTATANVKPGEIDGSYIFCLAVAPTYEAYTLLKWLAENDPDFPTDRPARIGGAAWSDAYSNIWFKAAKDYCEAHPDQYEWTKGYLTDMKFVWDTEVHGLMDSDYVYVPIPPQTFVKSYRQAGGEGKFISTEPGAAFLGLIDKMGLWEEFDGSIYVLSTSWYNEEGEIAELMNQLLEDYHSPTEVNDIRINGCGYRAVKQALMICDIIKDTIDRVGIENFSREELVNTSVQWSFDLDEIENFQNFTETKRFSQNYYGIFEVVVDESRQPWEYMTRVSDPIWIPQVTQP
ncbi:MAG: ABC transporter substrate-binding protein [Dehalococcoidia bacterium]